MCDFLFASFRRIAFMQKYPQKSKSRMVWECSRKKFFWSEEIAEDAAIRLKCRAYKCTYGEHYHLTHKPDKKPLVKDSAAVIADQ